MHNKLDYAVWKRWCWSGEILCRYLSSNKSKHKRLKLAIPFTWLLVKFVCDRWCTVNTTLGAWGNTVWKLDNKNSCEPCKMLTRREGVIELMRRQEWFDGTEAVFRWRHGIRVSLDVYICTVWPFNLPVWEYFGQLNLYNRMSDFWVVDTVRCTKALPIWCSC